jgi:LemA protein
VEILTLLLLLALLGFWMLGAYNRLVRLRNASMSLFSQVEQHARERHGLVEKLAQTLRSVLTEQRDLVEIAAASARQAGTALEATKPRPLRANTMQQLSRTEEVLDQALTRLDEALRRHVAQQASDTDAAAPAKPATDTEEPADPAAAHPPPSLAELLTRLDGVQAQNDFARQVYNQAASDYNAALRLFPTTVVAGLFRFEAVATMPLARHRN